jgi:hypothetical protein
MNPHEARIRAALECVRGVLEGGVGPGEGYRLVARALAGMPEELRSDENAEFIVAVDSELDSYPSGEARKLWDCHALERLDGQLAVYLGRVHEDMEKALRALRARLLRQLQ